MLVVAALAVAAIYFVFDPGAAEWMPKCLFHRLTGYDCPGCGSQRMLHSLLHGDLREAWESNALLLTGLPYLLFWLWVEMSPRRNPAHPCHSVRLRRISEKLNSQRAVMVISVVIVGWGVVRNAGIWVR